MGCENLDFIPLGKNNFQNKQKTRVAPIQRGKTWEVLFLVRIRKNFCAKSKQCKESVNPYKY